MNKAVKLALAIFVGLDVFVAGFFLLANLRVAWFGMGSIPGGGSAIDMAIVLLPAFLGWVTADRLYFFLNYKQRKMRKQQELAEQKLHVEKILEEAEMVGVTSVSIWDERDWDEKPTPKIDAK
jgi:hypothetical protein